MKAIKSNIHYLTQVYPPLLVLLAIFPTLLSYIINADLAEARNILIHLIWLPFFTISYLLFKKKWIYRFAASFYFLMGSLEIIHWSLLKGPITVLSLIALVNTNPNESSESLSILMVKQPFGLLGLIPFTALYIYNLMRPLELSSENSKKYVVYLVALISFGFIGENIYKSRLIRKGIPPVIKTFASFFSEMQDFQEAMLAKSPKEIEVSIQNDFESQTFVLIIGESINRNHMELYGYSRANNPNLKNRDDLLIFNDVVAAYSNTISSVLAMLSNSSVAQPIAVDESIDIIDVFHSAGFETYWLSNQSPVGIWDNIITKFANKADHRIFVNTTSNNSTESFNNASYDERLFEPFNLALSDTSQKKLIIIHLMGNHVSYAKRYPSNFEFFTGENDKEKIIASYDNSILYNDFIVDSLLNALGKKSEHLSAAIYLGDHGENVYDEGKNMGHDYSGKLPKANVEIPFLIWFSPSFLEHDLTSCEMASTQQKTAFVSDDLFHLILDLNGISCSVYEAERSLLNPNYLPKKRVLEDGYDYDQP